MDSLPDYFRIGGRLIAKKNISLIMVDDKECKVFVNDNFPMVYVFGSFGYNFFRKIYESYDDESSKIQTL